MVVDAWWKPEDKVDVADMIAFRLNKPHKLVTHIHGECGGHTMHPSWPSSPLVNQHGVKSCWNLSPLMVCMLRVCMHNIVNAFHDAKLLGIVKKEFDVMEGQKVGKSEAKVANFMFNLMWKQVWVMVLDNKPCKR